MRVTLIHNPDAGDDRQPGGDHLCQLIEDAGHEVTPYTAAGNDWAGALSRATDLIAVGGGDGTIGRVAKRLVGRGIPIAVLPLGTANNISRTLGLADIAVDELIAGWDLSRRVTFDVGMADGPWGRRYFLEGLGVGVLVGMMRDASDRIERAGLADAEEKIACALRMLQERVAACPVHGLEADLDGRDLSGEYLMLEALNTRFIGPNLYLAPDARPADGLLDVVLIDEAQRGKLCDYLRTWQQGRLLPPDLPVQRGRQLKFRWNACELHIDDEVCPDVGGLAAGGASTIAASVRRDALEFLAADGRPSRPT
jgi:diacylglycerol kinase family enzyme